MRRRIAKLVLVALASLAVAVPPAGASAAPVDPVGGCGQGYTLITIKDLLKSGIVAPGFGEEDFVAADKNRDNFLCIKIIPNEGGPPQFDPAFSFLDNNARLR